MEICWLTLRCSGSFRNVRAHLDGDVVAHYGMWYSYFSNNSPDCWGSLVGIVLHSSLHLSTNPTAVGIYYPHGFARFNSYCLVWQCWLAAVAFQLYKHTLHMPKKLCFVYYNWFLVFRWFMQILIVGIYGPQEAVRIRVLKKGKRHCPLPSSLLIY